MFTDDPKPPGRRASPDPAGCRFAEPEDFVGALIHLLSDASFPYTAGAMYLTAGTPHADLARALLCRRRGCWLMGRRTRRRAGPRRPDVAITDTNAEIPTPQAVGPPGSRCHCSRSHSRPSRGDTDADW